MLKTKGYALWLMPDGEVYNKLNGLILQLSKKYNMPYFEPHVTLIDEVSGSEREIVSKTTQLASVTRPYKIELGKVEYLNEYFRCLFIKAQETERANLEARKIFGRKDDQKYMPHLSLMYGNFPPKTKEEIIKEIGKRMKLGFDVNSIHLFSINGEVKNWYRVKEFPLK